VLLIVALTAVLTTRHGAVRPIPAVSAGPAASRTPSQPAEHSPTPTYSPKPSPDRSAIVPGCMKSLNPASVGVPAADIAGPKLYNLTGTPTKGLALIYTKAYMLFCIIGGDVEAYNAGGGPIQNLHWIPAPVRVDRSDESILVNEAGTSRATWMLAGRVTSDVRKLSVTIGGVTAAVPVVNGTFIAEIHYLEADPNSRERPVVRAFDANGKTLGGHHPKCTGQATGCTYWP
jgi:hypothetical protein